MADGVELVLSEAHAVALAGPNLFREAHNQGLQFLIAVNQLRDLRRLNAERDAYIFLPAFRGLHPLDYLAD